jgi:predicted DNA-binding transcriptional regulator AlpA
MPRLSVHTPAEPAAPAAPPLVPPSLLLRARQAAALCDVSLATWHRWQAAARCPAPVRIGATVRWRADELADWIAAGCPCRKEWDARRAAGNANGRPPGRTGR